MKRIIKSSASNKPVYMFYICYNEKTAYRGEEGVVTTYDEVPYRCTDDADAYLTAASIIYDETKEEILEEFEDPYHIIDDQDPGAGFPYVYGIKKNGQFIWKDLDFDYWREQHDNFLYNRDDSDDLDDLDD